MHPDEYLKSDADFSNFRLLDLKATQGIGKAPEKNIVSLYVKDNFDEVIKHFNSTDNNFGLSPHIVVLLGRDVQSIFSEHMKNRLKDKSLKWVGMPHPSPSSAVSYEGLIYASQHIRQYLKPIDERGYRWTYNKNNFDDWRFM